ncbi:MAG TPA: cystathionine gamma-synthase [Longimicrobiales bacterium]
MSTVLKPAPARARAAAIGTLPLEHGGALHDVRIAYETYGDPQAAAVLVLGGISAGRHLLPTDADPRPGWWPGVAGAGHALDPERWHLIAIDHAGGRGDSSHPRPGEEWPALTTRDQADAIVALLDAIGVARLHAVVGASYGGMVALALAARAPGRVARVVALCAAHRPHAMATAIRSVQRRIVRDAMRRGDGARGVGIARALAITTYRTAAEFDGRFRGTPRFDDGVARLPVDSYLDHHAREYARTFPPECFLTLSQSLDLHAVEPDAIRAACTLICFDSDTLVPPRDVRALAAALPHGAAVTCIETPYGHDGFLKETDAVSRALRRALADEPVEPPGLAGAPPPCGADGAPVTHYAARSTRAGADAATTAVRAGIATDAQHGAVIPPIHLSTTFSFDGLDGRRTYDYTRSGNPTRDLLAGAIAELEHGAAGIVTATGMAAIAVVLQLLRPGDLLIAPHDGYGGTYRLMRALARRQALDLELLDLTRPDACAHIRARAPRMVWIETPSNPLLRITDIAAVAAAARAAGALCVVDNTFLSPALQTPLDLGADIVVHSTTKYLNGHSDVVGGAIVARTAALGEELGWWANCTGATGSPFDAYLTLRGLRTLHARMRVHEENARAVAELLHAHDAVGAVYHPGLRAHRGHEIAARQQRGFGAMVSFELRGGIPAVERFVGALRCFTLAESLGGVESLVAHPATMTHAAMDPAARRAAGITDSLLRLSVGIEAVEDQLCDVRRALACAGHEVAGPGPDR